MKRVKSVSYKEGLLERLKDPNYAAQYLMACWVDKEGDPEELFLLALMDVAKAHSVREVATKANLGRESLYKAMSKKGNPKLSTLNSILEAVGLKIVIKPKKEAA